MRYVLMMGAALSVLASPALAKDIPVEAALKAATVYNDRAALTREVKVQIPAGKHTVIFEDLPGGLYPDSLRIEGAGAAAVTLGALSHKIVNKRDLVNEKEQALQAQIKALNEKRALLNVEKEAQAKKSAFFEQLLSVAQKSTQEEITVYEFNTDKWMAAADTAHKGLVESYKAEQDIHARTRDLDEQVKKLQRDLNQVRTGSKSTYEVRLPVEASGGGDVTLSLSYQIGGARWYPVYDARLDTAEEALELTQFGSVMQHTGEDWSDIELTLSTARPQRGANLPALNPMWVSFYQRKPRADSFANVSANMTGSMPLEAPLGVISEDDDEGEPMKRWRRLQEERVQKETSQRAEMQAANVNTGGFTAEYIIPGPSSVPSDGTAAKLFIGTMDTDVSLERHIKPQIDSKAYLVANLSLQGEENTVLPGMVNLFRDNAFIGQTAAGFLKPGQDIDVPFGIDDQIEVERKTLKDEKAESGMFVGKSEVLERHYVTDIQNLRGEPVTIVVEETVPASKDENIKLEVLTAHTSKDFVRDADKVKGLLRWDFALEPKSEKAVELGWRLSWPKDQKLSGLR